MNRIESNRMMLVSRVKSGKWGWIEGGYSMYLKDEIWDEKLYKKINDIGFHHIHMNMNKYTVAHGIRRIAIFFMQEKYINLLKIWEFGFRSDKSHFIWFDFWIFTFFCSENETKMTIFCLKTRTENDGNVKFSSLCLCDREYQEFRSRKFSGNISL